jgi:outer membrane protein assembly factor BamB
MPRTFRVRLIWFGCFLATSATTINLLAANNPDCFVSADLLEQAKLKMLWQNELPLKYGERLEHISTIGGRIYVRSNQNYMFSLDRQKGTIIFSGAIAPPGIPVLGLEPYENTLLSVIGNKLVVIDSLTGIERRIRNLIFSVICPPVRNSSYFYLGGTDRRLHALHGDDGVQIFEVAADDDSMVTSIVADDNSVIFATDTGKVISIAPDRPLRLWQFNATDAIAGRIVKDGSSLFFASKDTCVYRLDIIESRTVKLIWKYQTEAILDQPPRVTEGIIYQYGPGKGLAAIDRQSGNRIWSLQEGVDLLAESADRAYVITDVPTLTVMNNSKAKRLYSVNLAAMSKYGTNITDSRIYIADENGRIVCLEPIKQ